MVIRYFQILAVSVIALAGVQAQARPPATQPDRAELRPDKRPLAALARLDAALQKIGLSDDQKSRVQSILADTRQQFQDLREKSNGDATQLRDGARQILANTRQQLIGVLTPEQAGHLRDLMQAEREDSGQPRGGDRRPQPPQMDPPEMRENDRASNEAPDAPLKAAAKPSGPSAGEPAPDFKLEKLDGRPVQLSTFKDRILVLIFGSYSSPSFRQRADAIQQLSRELGARASVLIIYTKEAHPNDGWQVERNRDDNVLIEAHKDQPARIAQAKLARDALKLSVPIAVDDMSDSAASAYGAGENGAFVIGRDGKILARQDWADPYALQRAVDRASRKSAD